MNGVGYLDVGTAPATVISRFNDFLRGFASLSHSLSHLLGNNFVIILESQVDFSSRISFD